MAGTVGSPYRKILVAVLVTLGCMALLLFSSRLVSAQQIVATWYGPGFEGNLTANGEVFDPSGYTAAHRTYDFDTKLIVTYEGRSVVVRINDRGPYVSGRDLDLAQGAAEYIGLTAVGVDTVNIQVAAPSTPVGPYAPRSKDKSTKQAAPAASDKPSQNKPARRQNGPESNKLAQAADADQYASEDQYATEDQYEVEGQVQEIAPAPPAPKPAVPVLPPEPEPEALESPPVELAVPNSTVKKRVEFEVAAAPTPQPVQEEVAEPAPEPQPIEEEDPEPEEELTVLPDTGGVPLSTPAVGALLIALGISVRILRR